MIPLTLFLLISILFTMHFALAYLEWRRCKGRLASEIEDAASRERRHLLIRRGPPPVSVLSRAPSWRLSRSRVIRIILMACYLILGTASAQADDAVTTGDTRMPVRVELGGFGSGVTQPYGNWYGENGQIWIRSLPRIIPAFTFESQTRPQGTQENYSFLSYLNWTKSFYTVQSVTFAPQNGSQAIYYPRDREDVKAFWKVPPGRQLVLGLGITRFNYGAPGRGQIYNAGAIYYRKRLVLEGNLFVNRNQPRNLISASGVLAAQFGSEGHYWLGATVSGGRELYNFSGVAPFDISLYSYSAEGFYRKWITHHTGYKVSVLYLQKLGAYRQIGCSTSFFFDF